MASSIVQKLLSSSKNTNINSGIFYTVVRHTSIPPKRKNKLGTIKHRNLIESSCESLAAKGFLRSYKPYTPKSDVQEKINAICNEVLGSRYEQTAVLSREDKFTLLTACFEQLNHSVPNSLLHKINTVDDVIEFYETPVSTTTPLDEFRSQDLPPNLHIQYDYVRFDSNSDIKFDGITAFPESSTVVTGLKYKGKYQGYKAKPPYYYDNLVHFDKEDIY